MQKRRLIIVVTALGILAGSGLLARYLSSQKEPPKKKFTPTNKRYVKTEKVAYRSVPTRIEAFGRVKTAQSLDLIAEVSGRMRSVSIPLKQGQRFGKGSLLYKIDDAEQRLNLQAQKSNFLRDVAAILPDIKVDFPRVYDKWQNYFSSIDLDSPLPKLPAYNSDKEKTFMATKNIFSAYYAIKSAEANLRKYYFYAPFDGVISQVLLQSGSFVNPGSRVATIIRTDRLEIKVDVDVANIDWITTGAPAGVKTENGHEWPGKVARIGGFVNQKTQSVDVYISITPQKGKPLYDGEYLASVIPGKAIEQGMQIPRNAVFDQNKVFILQDSLLRVREVDIRKISAEHIVFSGLPEGIELVVEPLINAHNGMKAYKLGGEQNTKAIDIESKTDDALLTEGTP